MTEKNYNTQIFNDPIPCNAEGCIEGFIITWEIDDDGIDQPIKEKCEFCDDYGNLK